MTRCRKCLYPDTKPDLPFKDGICSACENHGNRPDIDWDARLEKLEQLLNDANGSVMVPSSGGKDSTYIALRLKEFGADVTAVTVATDYLTPLGRRNIDSLKRHVRTIEFTPNDRVRSLLCKKAFELVGDVSWPEHVLIHRIPFGFAHDLCVPLIFYGECPNNQYGGPEGTADIGQMTQDWVSEYGGFLGLRAEDFIGPEISDKDMRDYKRPPESADYAVHFLGWFEPWDSHRNAEYAIESGMQAKLPCEANWWEWENLDNALTGLHDHGMYRKYGYGRAVAQLGVDIRDGRISRDDALAIAKDRDGMFPFIYAEVPLGQTLDWLGLSSARLADILDDHTNWDLFSGVEDGRPILKEFDAKD